MNSTEQKKMEDDPYAVLMLERGKSTVQNLHDNYYRLSAQLHPSKCKLPRRAAHHILRLLETSFEKVENDLVNRTKGKRGSSSVSSYDHHSIKPVCSGHHVSSNKVSNNEEKTKELAKKFDMARFNKIFEENRPTTVYDNGYDEWMKNDMIEAENVPKACDEYDETFEPNACTFSKGRGMGFSELGLENVHDFGNVHDMKLRNNNAIQYADIRDAHTVRNNMVNSRLYTEFKMKQKTLDEIKAERENEQTFRLTPLQRRALEERMARQDASEKERMYKMIRSDEAAAINFNRVHAKMFDQSPDMN